MAVVERQAQLLVVEQPLGVGNRVRARGEGTGEGETVINPATCEIQNEQLVALSPSGAVIQVTNAFYGMTREQALVHAAWLVALAEEKDGQFERILRRVRNTTERRRIRQAHHLGG
jgi:hypothetical protein